MTQESDDPAVLIRELADALDEAADYVELMLDSSGEDSGEADIIERFEALVNRARRYTTDAQVRTEE